MSACEFCEIIAGEIEASFVHRDGQCSAFMDIAPINEGHVLVAPDRHVERLSGLDASSAAHLIGVGHRIAAALVGSSVRCDGVLFFLADGEAAGQEVPHLHLHVVPRYHGDGVRLLSQARPRSREELDATASNIAAALD